MTEFQQIALLLMLTVSVILQFCAGFLAFHLMRLSRNNLSWIMITAALLLAAVRQSVFFYHSMNGGGTHIPDLYAEILTFVIALLLVSGLLSIAPLMRRLYSSPAVPDGGTLSELFEKTTSGVAVYEATDKGRDFIISDINPAAERIEKTARQHVVGRRLTEVFPGIEEFGLLEVLRRVWKTGQPESFPLHYYQDGRISGWRDNFVYRRPSGEIVTVYNDVSAQMHLQEEMERRERKFRLLFEQSPLPCQSLDNEGRILEVNPAWVRFTGIERTLAAGRQFRELLTRTGRQRFQEGLAGLEKNGSADLTALELRRSDSVMLNIDMNLLPLRSRPGEVEQIYCILREKTGQEPEAKSVVEKQARILAGELLAGERRELQRKRIAMLGELTAGMAHELNMPLTAARNAFNLMCKDMSPTGPHYEFVEMVSRELSGMADLVERMYRFHEPVSPECELLNVNALLDNTLVLVRSLMRDRRIQLRDERSKTVPSVMLPPGAVMLTLVNPVKNSIESMPPDGILTLRTGPAEQGGVFIEIEDNGPGIPPEFLPHLFEPFTTFRQNGTGYGRTGLGMAMVHRTLDALGGTVTAHSQSGEGTCVRIVLPAAMETNRQGV